MPTDDSVVAAFRAALANTSAAPSGSGSTTPDPEFFLGETSGRGFAGGTIKVGGMGQDNVTGPNLQNVAKTNTVSGGQQMWYQWSPQQQLAWAKKAYALGYLQSPTDVQGAQQLWMSAISESAKYFAANKNISPWQVLDINSGSNADTLKKRGTMNPDGSITHTNTSIDLSDKASVEALATQVLQQALGRDPTQSEVNTYYNTIRGQEQSHPTTTTSTTDASGNTSQTTSGGFGATDAQELLKQQVQNDPEFGKYQSGTTYFGAAMSALGAVGGA